MSSSGRTTLRDVARIAGVSHNTVSLVVRGSDRVLPETRARVEAVIEHLGYQPHAAASALRSSRSGVIGYLINRPLGPETQTEVDAFRNRVWHGISDTADAGGYFVLHAGFSDIRRSRALLSSGRVDGLLVDFLIGDDSLDELVSNTGLPVVLIGRSTEVPGVAWVRADEEGGAYAATRHLTELGHTAIGLVSVRSEDHPVVREREAGMRRALAGSGLPTLTPRWFGDWTFESGYSLGLEITRSGHRPSALFVLNELMAFGCLQAAKSNGDTLPGDLAIVTVEDSRLVDYVRPALTAVHVPMYQVARRATEVLLAAIEGGQRGLGETLDTLFVVRASSSPSANAPAVRANIKARPKTRTVDPGDEPTRRPGHSRRTK
jgi:LacI family transcriptional regulator